MSPDKDEKTDMALIVVTAVPIVVLILRHFVKSFVVDNYTIYLILIAMTPWLAPWVKSFEIAGIGKLDLEGMQEAARKEGLIENDAKPDYLSKAKSLVPIGSETKGELVKSLVNIMNHIEKMAPGKTITTQKGLAGVINGLTIDENQKCLLHGVASIYGNILKGKSINSQVAEFALKIGPGLLKKLEDRQSSASP